MLTHLAQATLSEADILPRLHRELAGHLRSISQ